MGISDTASKIALLVKIAKINGSLLSIEDLSTLLSDKLTPKQVQEFLSETPILNGRFELNDGYLLERGRPKTIVAKVKENHKRARNYISAILPLINKMKRGSLIIGISGSVSYNSAAESDDVDLFCITKKDSLWIFMTESLILTRIYRMLRNAQPFVCLSCTMDSEFASKIFRTNNDPLFARDALTAIILHGEELYYELIRSNERMEKYFPNLYKIKVSKSSFRIKEGNSNLRRILNALLFYTVGRYIRIKAYLFNRMLTKKRRNEAYFVVKAGLDHCIYESQRYMLMRQIYKAFIK